MKKRILIIVIVLVVFAGILVAFFISRLNSSDLNNQESQISTVPEGMSFWLMVTVSTMSSVIS